MAKTCLKILDDSERKVEILVEETGGKKRLQALSVEEEVL